jgi:tyrosine-protein phosphatase YwqE
MKIDIHSHILPGIDDGAKTLSESLKLIHAMQGWGFERVYCTPHINSLYMNTPESILRAFDNVKEAIELIGCRLEIRMSAEYRLVPETWPEVLERKWLMPIEDKYILMELPIKTPKDMKGISPVEEFKRIKAMGLTPVLPHPERYFYLDKAELMSYLEAGALIQCNYGSVAGLYGEESQKIARNLADEGLVAFWGTDLHNMHYVDVLTRWFSEDNPVYEF